ncbi:MAG: hypothetical protein HC929_07735 [Leptolyngbyaceae cyanobacterium SM2_5_2]|nr:hypothetical protein [Leptolyngbyaceae cyanobacterium SM2_5_2]
MVTKETEFVISEESHNLAWFALEDLLNISRSVDLVRMTHKLSGRMKAEG